MKIQLLLVNFLGYIFENNVLSRIYSHKRAMSILPLRCSHALGLGATPSRVQPLETSVARRLQISRASDIGERVLGGKLLRNSCFVRKEQKKYIRPEHLQRKMSSFGPRDHWGSVSRKKTVE